MPQTIPTATRWRPRLVLALVAAVILPAGLVVLYRYPPTENDYYPKCMFHLATGLHCPGCGATRCLHALLHGDLPQALAYNPLLVAALPILATSLLFSVYTSITGRSLLTWRLPRWAVYVLFGVVVAYWVLRNIDVYPLTLLAPHTL